MLRFTEEHADCGSVRAACGECQLNDARTDGGLTDGIVGPLSIRACPPASTDVGAVHERLDCS